MTDGNSDPDDVPYRFKYGATLRIFGEIADLDAITRTLGLSPTHTHRRGDRRGGRSEPFEHDMWSYASPVADDRPLDEHLQTLWESLKPHTAYLKSLKEGLTVDVFCRYSSDCESAGFEVSHRSLEIFTELEVPFGVSVVVAIGLDPA